MKVMTKDNPNFPLIENPSDYIGYKCHVVGWKSGCVFKIISHDNGITTLQTPKTGRVFKTSNQLTQLKRRKFL